jgi:hypothetical protein
LSLRGITGNNRLDRTVAGKRIVHSCRNAVYRAEPIWLAAATRACEDDRW